MRTKYGDGAAQSEWAVVNSLPHRERIAFDNLLRQVY